MRNDERVRAVEDLMNLRVPVMDAVQRLRGFPWDSECVATLTTGHLTVVLERYVAERLTAAEVEQWADGIEGREDIELDREGEPILREALFALANPALTEPLTPEAAQRWLQTRLKKKL